MDSISEGDAALIRDLQSRFGDLTFRTLMTGESSRLVRPVRASKWVSGHGRLSSFERERLQALKTNAVAIENLKKKNSSKRTFKVNRSIRNWVAHGKSKDVVYSDQNKEERDSQQKAIKSLRFLGVDPSEGTYYVRKRKQ